MLIQPLTFSPHQTAMAAHISQSSELPAAFRALHLDPPRPVIVLIAGASGQQPEHERAIQQVAQVIAQVATQLGAAVIDGGTHSGGMKAMGTARAETGGTFPLIGVAAESTVNLPACQATPEQSGLDPNHSHFILVPGSNWGDESPWIDAVAAALAGVRPSLTVLVNGGAIGRQDVNISLAAGRQVLVMQGTGRLADELATNPPAAPLLRVLPSQEPSAFAQTLRSALQK